MWWLFTYKPNQSNSTKVNIERGLKSTNTSVMVKGTSMVCGFCPGKGTSPSSCPWRATYKKHPNIPLNKHLCPAATIQSIILFCGHECGLNVHLWRPPGHVQLQGWRTCFDCDSRSFCVVTCAGKVECHKQAQTALLLSWTLFLFLERPPPNRLLSIQ